MEAAYTPETSASLPTSTRGKETTTRILIAKLEYPALLQGHKCLTSVSDIWCDHKEGPVKCSSLRSFAFLKRLKLYEYISSVKTNLPVFIVRVSNCQIATRVSPVVRERFSRGTRQKIWAR
jgi:hypothetical protein